MRKLRSLAGADGKAAFDFQKIGVSADASLISINGMGRRARRYRSYQPTRVASASLCLRASCSMSEQDGLAPTRR